MCRATRLPSLVLATRCLKGDSHRHPYEWLSIYHLSCETAISVSEHTTLSDESYLIWACCIIDPTLGPDYLIIASYPVVFFKQR